MKLSKSTINVLKNFSVVNPSILLRQGNLVMTKAINGVTYAECNIDDVITDEMGIYDLNGFLAVLNQLGEDSDITVDNVNEAINVRNKRVVVSIPLSDASSIVSPKKQLVMKATDVIFELTGEQLDEISKLARVVKGDSIAITNENGRIKIDCFSSEDDAEKTLFSIDIAEYDGSNKFRFVLLLCNMKIIPDTYKVMVNAAGAVQFESEKIKYVVVLQAKTTHDF